MGFKYWTGQIEHRFANSSPPLRLFFKRNCVAQAQCRGEGPSKLVTRLGVIQSGILKIRFFWSIFFRRFIYWGMLYQLPLYANKRLNHCSTHKITENIVSKMCKIFLLKSTELRYRVPVPSVLFSKNVTNKVPPVLFQQSNGKSTVGTFEVPSGPPLNMINQISRIRVTAKKLRIKNKLFLLCSSELSMDRKPRTSSGRNLPFFWNRNGLESIFYLPEQEEEFLNLRLILFMKGFLQLTAQFSSNLFALEMATAQRTQPRAVVGAPRRAAWQLKSALRNNVSAALRTIIFYKARYNYCWWIISVCTTMVSHDITI